MKKRKRIGWLVLLGMAFLLVACGETEVPETPGRYTIGNAELSEWLAPEEGAQSAGVFVYFGRATCPLCQEFEPILDEALQQLEMPLMHFETDLARAEDEDAMLALLETLGVTAIPVVVYLENGQIQDFLLGVYELDAVVAFFEAHTAAD